MTSLYRHERGLNRGSFMDRVLDQNEKNGLSPSKLYLLGGVLMEGGSDTSSSLILAMVRAIMEFPDVQKRSFSHLVERAIAQIALIPRTEPTPKSIPSSATTGLQPGPTFPACRTST